MVSKNGFQNGKEYEFIQNKLGDFIFRWDFCFIDFLKENNIDFVISGSSSLYINGYLDRKPKDIDLNMDENNFNKLKELTKNSYCSFYESNTYEEDGEVVVDDWFGDFTVKEVKKKNKNPFPVMCKKFYKFIYYDGVRYHRYDIFVCNENTKDFQEVNGLKIMTLWGMIKIKMLINVCYNKIKKVDGFHYKTKIKHLKDTFEIFGKIANKKLD